MEPILVHPSPPPPVVSQSLDLSGYAWTGVADVEEAIAREPEEGWAAAIVVAVTEPEDAFEVCRALRKDDDARPPLLAIVAVEQLDVLDYGADLFDDLCVLPFQPAEIDARLRMLFQRSGGGDRPDVVSYGPLALNLETYQAVIEGRPLDLTYMEYELLKFLASHPGKVFSREVLLSRVWGYEYYGGARTVDVHVRRLRAKLGEEHAGLIQTVRSVGYRFGQSRWL